MYRIFFDDRVLVISDKVNQFTRYNALYYRYDSPGDLKKLLYAFSSDLSHITSLFIETDEPDVVYGHCVNHYRYIRAAGGLVQNIDGHILCIYRLGKWDLPKGKMDPGESPQQTAIREVEEECGITGLVPGKLLSSTFHVYQRDGVFFLKQTFWFAMQVGDVRFLTPQQEEGIEEVRFIAQEEMGIVLSNTYASIRFLLAELGIQDAS